MARTLARWRPLSELEDMRRRMERLFEEIGDGEAARSWGPSIDLVEREDTYVLRADVPGMKPEEIKIEVLDDVLTVSGSHEESEEAKKDDYIRRERRYGAFKRTVELPTGVTSDDVKATCRDGVLEVTFPRPTEKERRAVTITPTAA